MKDNFDEFFGAAVLVAVAILSVFIMFVIAGSNLPDWVKFALLNR